MLHYLDVISQEIKAMCKILLEKIYAKHVSKFINVNQQLDEKLKNSTSFRDDIELQEW